jgi:hypothetical protein
MVPMPPLTVSGWWGTFFPSRAHPSTPYRVDPPLLIISPSQTSLNRFRNGWIQGSMWLDPAPFRGLGFLSWAMLEPG